MQTTLLGLALKTTTVQWEKLWYRILPLNTNNPNSIIVIKQTQSGQVKEIDTDRI